MSTLSAAPQRPTGPSSFKSRPEFNEHLDRASKQCVSDASSSVTAGTVAAADYLADSSLPKIGEDTAGALGSLGKMVGKAIGSAVDAAKEHIGNAIEEKRRQTKVDDLANQCDWGKNQSACTSAEEQLLWNRANAQKPSVIDKNIAQLENWGRNAKAQVVRIKENLVSLGVPESEALMRSIIYVAAQDNCGILEGAATALNPNKAGVIAKNLPHGNNITKESAEKVLRRPDIFGTAGKIGQSTENSLQTPSARASTERKDSWEAIYDDAYRPPETRTIKPGANAQADIVYNTKGLSNPERIQYLKETLSRLAKDHWDCEPFSSKGQHTTLYCPEGSKHGPAVLSIDVAHGAYEKCDPKTGKHQGELQLDETLEKQDTSGKHDCEVPDGSFKKRVDSQFRSSVKTH